MREVKRAGVGQHREVDVGGDLAGQRHAERFDQREHHLAARRRRFVDPVDGAVDRVARMMIDVDHRRSIEPRHAGARQVAALHDQRRIERVGDLRRDLNAGDLRETAAGIPAGSRR